jgi:hypothetical protein
MSTDTSLRLAPNQSSIQHHCVAFVSDYDAKQTYAKLEQDLRNSTLLVRFSKSALARASAEVLEEPIVFDELTQSYPD